MMFELDPRSTLQSTSMRPPIGGENSDVQVALRDELCANINGGLGSIGVFADNSRHRTVVLITSSGAWSLVEPLRPHRPTAERLAES